MTTIVYSRGVIASDTMWCYGDAYKVNMPKIVMSQSDDYSYLVSLAGTVDLDIYTVAALLAECDDPYTLKDQLDWPDEAQSDLLIAQHSADGYNIYQVQEDFVCWHNPKYPYAIGSGAPIAISAVVTSGKKAPDAVKAAMSTDIFTGGYIHSYDLSKKELELTINE